MNEVSGLKFFRLLLFIVLLLAAQPRAYSQESETDLKEQAAKLFDAEKYLDATPLYLRLLALSPRSFDYSYRYGTCLLYNSYKKQDAFKYLNYAVSDPAIDVQAFYFLGKAYHLNYQFNEAIKNYELYKQKSGGKPKASFEVDRQIEMCQNGKRLLITITDLVVLEKKEVELSKFFRQYKLDDIGGDILVAADYQSKIDKKKGHVPLIHFPKDSKEIYYSSYGDNDNGQKDIYVRKLLPNGTWGLPQPVAGSVNTKYDEDFPYMHPGGEYLYFCSKGHNSMGGYDVFRSRFDAGTNTFGPPENMDFAISSPDNDLFYIADSLGKNAYFASSRQSSNGNIHVYKVRVDRVPLQLAVIKGSFASTIHPDNKKITITVTDFASGTAIGTFTSNERGSYLITLPKGGKYQYDMKVEGGSVSHKYVVTVPYIKEFKPLKQRIQEELLEDGEVVKVIDLFGEEVDDPMGVLAEVIKLRSELNPNASQFNLTGLDSGADDKKILAELGFENAGPQDIIAAFEQLENKQQEKVKTSENLSNGALSEASKKLDEAAKKLEAAKTLVNRATSASSKEQKYTLLLEAQENATAASSLEEQARSLMAFSDSVTKKGAADKELLASIEAVTGEVRKEVTANNIPELKNLITGNSRTIAAVTGSEEKDPVDVLIDQKLAVRKNKENWTQQRDSYTKTEQQLEAEIKTLQASLLTAKKKDQPDIEREIASKTGEKNMVTEEKENLERKVVKATKQEDALTERIQFLQGITQVNGGPVTSATEVQNKLNAVDSKNNNTLTSYIDLQVSEMKKDPQLAASGQEKDPVVETLEGKYDDRVTAINNETFGSPAAKTQQLLTTEREFAGQIDSELNKVEAELKKDPENKTALERKEALTALRAETADRITGREAELAFQQQGNPQKAITPETELADIAPGHTATLQAAKGTTLKATLEAKNAVDRELIGKISDALTAVDVQLKTNPNDQQAKDHRRALIALTTETEDRMAARDQEIAQLNANTPSSTEITPESELALLAPDHETALQAAKGATPKATLEAKNVVDQALVDKVDALLDDVYDQISENPGDTKLKERKEALLELAEQAEDRIEQREAEIAALPVTTVTPTAAEAELTALMPDYEAQIAAATGSTPVQTLEAKNEVDEDLIDKIDSELEDIEGQLVRNPANSEATQRQAVLAELKQQAEKRVQQRKDAIEDAIAEPSGTSSVAEIAERIRPEYRENIGKIEATMEDGPKKELALLGEEKDLLTAIGKQLAKKETEAVKAPENTELKKEIADLKSAQDVQEAKVSERELDLIALEKAKIDPARLQSDVLPDYRAPNVENRENYSETEIAAFTQQEQQLQDALIKRLRANEKKSEKKFDPRLAAENKVITQLMEQSVNRAQLLNEPVAGDGSVMERIAADLGDDTELLMESEPATVDEAKRIITDLKEYEAGLTEQLTALEDADPQDEEAIAQQEKQLAVVRKRIGAVESGLDEMESAVATTTDNPSDSEARKELKQLTETESQLVKKLAGTLTPAEKRATEKELTAVRNEKETTQSVVLKEGIAAAQAERKTEVASLGVTSDPTAKAAIERSNGLTASGNAKSTNRELTEQARNEEQAAVLLKTTKGYLDTKRIYDEKGLVAATRQELEAGKRRFLVEIGQLDVVIDRLKNDPAKVAEANEARSQRRGLQEAVDTIDGMIADLNEEKTPENPVKKGLKTPVSFEKETELASSPEYPALLEAYRGVQSTQRQLADVLKEKEAVRGQPAANPEEREALIVQLEDLAKEEKTLRGQLEQEQASLDAKLNGTQYPSEIRNLLARDVPPVKPVPVVLLVPAMTTGFELVATPPETRAVQNIPVDLKVPTGLVYRVQVGAFARPIPEDLFREFTPVTGEKLTNGITRYLAGYFGNRLNASDAQRQIRALGYADAFVVAYCDGNRISVAEARRLEEQGLCVAKNQDQLLLEVAESTLAQLPADSVEKLRPVIKPSDYNKAPGAVAAEAAEDHKGLYYTVQVGVYNRPVNAEQVKNIDPLITKRLENGQIRYSSGIFPNVETARPKRAEAVARGISDAFITAYYNGERISLDEAKRLLAESGADILEKEQTPLKPDAIEEAKQYAAAQPVVVSPKNERVQFVSKERYDEYPRDVIARLNSHGSFYYDLNDQRIKSAEYIPKEALALPDDLSEELDTVQTSENDAASIERKAAEVVAVWESTELSGATANWILRLTLPHTVVAAGAGFELIFGDVPDEDRESLIESLEYYGADRIKAEEEKQQ